MNMTNDQWRARAKKIIEAARNTAESRSLVWANYVSLQAEYPETWFSPESEADERLIEMAAYVEVMTRLAQIACRKLQWDFRKAIDEVSELVCDRHGIEKLKFHYSEKNQS